MRSLEARYPAGRALPVTELYLRQKQQQLVLPLGEEEEVAPRAASFLMEKPGTAAGATPGPRFGARRREKGWATWWRLSIIRPFV